MNGARFSVCSPSRTPRLSSRGEMKRKFPLSLDKICPWEYNSFINIPERKLSYMKRKIGINADCIRGGFIFGDIKKLGDLGFSGFFINFVQTSYGKCRDIGESVGMTFDFIHAPFRGINDMWLEGDAYLPLFNRMRSCIDTAATHAIPMVIIHLSSGWEPPAVNELGFFRFDKLVEHAKGKGVTIAFENLRNVENVLAAMERYRDESCVKYCYDCGHEHCYTQNFDWIKTFGDKLACIHVHDNYGYTREGDPDLHLLPFDGNLDYADMVRRLDEVGYEGPIMLEVFNSSTPEYAAMDNDTFMAECLARAKKIADMG